MDEDLKRKLKDAGWSVGDAKELLGLTDAESKYVEMKLSLARGLRESRIRLGLTQVEVAELIGSSQSRVAKMEAADPSVSIDLLLRSLLKLGATEREVSDLIRPKTPAGG